jgi:hypothetical protein
LNIILVSSGSPGIAAKRLTSEPYISEPWPVCKGMCPNYVVAFFGIIGYYQRVTWHVDVGVRNVEVGG